MARAERMLRDEQIAARGRHLQPDHPRRRASSPARCSSSSPPTRSCASGCPRLVGIELHIAFVFADGSVARGKPSDEDEQRLTRDDTTAARALPAVRASRPRRSGRSTTARCSWSRSSRVPGRRSCSIPRQRAALAADLARPHVAVESRRPCASRFAVSIPGSRSRRRSTTATPGIDLFARDRRHARGRAAAARSCRPASPSRSRTGYAGFVQPRSGLALRHGVTVVNSPGSRRRRLPRRDPGAAREPRSRSSRSRSAAVIASRSS